MLIVSVQFKIMIRVRLQEMLVNVLWKHCVSVQNSSVSQASGDKKKKVQLTWEAPSNSDYGDIYFRYTLIHTLGSLMTNLMKYSPTLMRMFSPMDPMKWTVLILITHSRSFFIVSPWQCHSGPGLHNVLGSAEQQLCETEQHWELCSWSEYGLTDWLTDCGCYL